MKNLEDKLKNQIPTFVIFQKFLKRPLCPVAVVLYTQFDNFNLPSASNELMNFKWFLYKYRIPNTKYKQEAQLPQRNSASAAHIEGGWTLQPTPPPPPLATPMRMVESETRNKRTSSVPSTKHTLRWIAQLRVRFTDGTLDIRFLWLSDIGAGYVWLNDCQRQKWRQWTVISEQRGLYEFSPTFTAEGVKNRS